MRSLGDEILWRLKVRERAASMDLFLLAVVVVRQEPTPQLQLQRLGTSDSRIMLSGLAGEHLGSSEEDTRTDG